MKDHCETEMLPEKAPRPVVITAPSNLPKLGEWYWVKHTPWGNKKKTESLACATHVASNHIVFSWSDEDGHQVRERIPFTSLMEDTRPEINWRAVIEKQIADKQLELQECVRSLADSCRNANLIDDVQSNPTTLLPSVTRHSPEEHKKRLLKLKKKTIPAIQKNIEQIIKEMVALQKDLFLPERAMADRLLEASEKIDDRLFALEIYAGLWEGIKQIADGEPATETTPITVRQLMLYMDEETLFDYDKGGMNYAKLSDFDRWVAKPENRDRLIPEQRCIVAFRVRRHSKDYGPISTISEALIRIEEIKADTWTYLLMRNGERMYRLGTEIDFSPRLLPLREEFHKPFEEEHRSHNWNTHKDKIEYESITPDHLDYDTHVEARAKKMTHYNRVLFLIQGLLDRSECFRPHPPINLMDSLDAETWFRPLHDEEDGLPSANPPKWEEYRDAHNAKIKTGSIVWAKWTERHKWSSRYNSSESREHTVTGVHEVTKISRDRKTIRISWQADDREGWEHPEGWYRGYGKWGKWPVNRKCHRTVPIEHCFNVSAYTPGDYKKFLCDHYLKGAYLEWAPQLLNAEKWHQQQRDPNWTEFKRKS